MATITFILIRTNMTNTAKADNNTEADNTGIMGITLEIKEDVETTIITFSNSCFDNGLMAVFFTIILY